MPEYVPVEVKPDFMVIHVEPSKLYSNVTVPSVIGTISAERDRVCPYNVVVEERDKLIDDDAFVTVIVLLILIDPL